MKKKEEYHFNYQFVAINHGATVLDNKNSIILNKTIKKLCLK